MAKRKDTGDTVEVMDWASGDVFFVSPPGRPEEGRLVARDLLDPDPWGAILAGEFVRWTWSDALRRRRGAEIPPP